MSAPALYTPCASCHWDITGIHAPFPTFRAHAAGEGPMEVTRYVSLFSKTILSWLSYPNRRRVLRPQGSRAWTNYVFVAGGNLPFHKQLIWLAYLSCTRFSLYLHLLYFSNTVRNYYLHSFLLLIDQQTNCGTDSQGTTIHSGCCTVCSLVNTSRPFHRIQSGMHMVLIIWRRKKTSNLDCYNGNLGFLIGLQVDWSQISESGLPTLSIFLGANQGLSICLP